MNLKLLHFSEDEIRLLCQQLTGMEWDHGIIEFTKLINREIKTKLGIDFNRESDYENFLNSLKSTQQASQDKPEPS